MVKLPLLGVPLDENELMPLASFQEECGTSRACASIQCQDDLISQNEMIMSELY